MVLVTLVVLAANDSPAQWAGWACNIHFVIVYNTDIVIEAICACRVCDGLLRAAADLEEGRERR
jgi:hypothetical protein